MKLMNVLKNKIKIRILAEPYINNPAPKLNQRIFDHLWENIGKLGIHMHVTELITMDVRLNQALPSSPVHFYITVNDIHHFHYECRDTGDTYCRKFEKKRKKIQQRKRSPSARASGFLDCIYRIDSVIGDYRREMLNRNKRDFRIKQLSELGID